MKLLLALISKWLGLTDDHQICIGKHITTTEMYKLLPTILRDFEFDMHLNGAKTWKVWAGWFHHQKDVFCNVRRRRERQKGVVVEVPTNGWRDD